MASIPDSDLGPPGPARAPGMIPSVTTVTVGAAAARVHRGICTACQPECAPASLSDHISDLSCIAGGGRADIEHPTRQELGTARGPVTNS
jgi:hypothetical protein